MHRAKRKIRPPWFYVQSNCSFTKITNYLEWSNSKSNRLAKQGWEIGRGRLEVPPILEELAWPWCVRVEERERDVGGALLGTSQEEGWTKRKEGEQQATKTRTKPNAIYKSQDDDMHEMQHGDMNKKQER